MKLLIFDTETTGLPKLWSKSALEERFNWPHIVSIGWILYDTETSEVLDKQYYVIRPQGWTIPLDAVRIHNISQHFAIAKGSDLLEVLNKFIDIPCDAWVAHNMDFDYNVLVSALRWDCGVTAFPHFPPQFCTMRTSAKRCNINLRGTTKWPSLSELYLHCTGKEPNKISLHNSLEDASLVLECLKTNEDIVNDIDLLIKEHNRYNAMD
jgi:DNA polymerase III epsilon subunit-like protein